MARTALTVEAGNPEGSLMVLEAASIEVILQLPCRLHIAETLGGFVLPLTSGGLPKDAEATIRAYDPEGMDAANAMITGAEFAKDPYELVRVLTAWFW